MAVIAKRGILPKTPHTEFYYLPGVLSLEEIHGTYGFNGPYSRKLHIRSYPTEQSKSPKKSDFNFALKAAPDDTLQPYHIFTYNIPFEGDPIRARKAILFGVSTTVSVSKPVKSMDENVFFKNGNKHEMYYVQDGEGILKTDYGNLVIKKGLYLIIPKGTPYRIELMSKNAFFLIFESNYMITFPPHYMNSSGQATLMSPVVETESDIPELQEPIDKKGDYWLDIKHTNENVTRLALSHHPFDIVGWEGSLYPFSFDINNHHGISREIHTAPPMRQTFQSGIAPHNGFSICSFVSQMEGWNPKDIAAPYAHSNVDSDEILFFSSSNYTAREGVIGQGSITFHPGAIPHSPHGDAAARSMKERAKVSNMLAVMIDTFFEDLLVTDIGYEFRDKDYALSWYKAKTGVGA